MSKTGKQFVAAKEKVEDKFYLIEEAVPLLQSLKFAKFDETVEMTLRLGVDPKHADQMVRGTVVLPHGLGRSKKVIGSVLKEIEKGYQEERSELKLRPQKRDKSN